MTFPDTVEQLDRLEQAIDSASEALSRTLPAPLVPSVEHYVLCARDSLRSLRSLAELAAPR